MRKWGWRHKARGSLPHFIISRDGKDVAYARTEQDALFIVDALNAAERLAYWTRLWYGQAEDDFDEDRRIDALRYRVLSHHIHPQADEAGA